MAEQLTLDLAPPASSSASANPPRTELLQLARAAQARRIKGPPVLFRHPLHGSTWTGRGKRPAWVTEALAQGMGLDDLRVTASPRRAVE